MLKRALSLTGAVFLFTLVSLFPTSAHAQCAAGQIDLAEYLVPAAGPEFYSQSCPDLVSRLKSRAGGPGHAGTVTGAPGELRTFEKNTEYELYSVTGSNVYHIEDTSWMSTCEDGAQAFYRVYTNGNLGGEYPRCLNVGQSYTTKPIEIRAFRETDWVERGELNECNARGEGTGTVTFQIEQYNASSDKYGPLGLPAGSETVIMHVTGGIGAGEYKYYTKDVGLTGFWDGSFHGVYHEGLDGDTTARRKLICDGDTEGKPAVFLYPESSSEIRKYLANSQVYCAPQQMYWPVHPQDTKILENCRQASDVGPGVGNNDGVCDETEYGIVDAEESIAASSMSLPLFRSDPGLISIEYDLSRVNPSDTLASAAARNSRSDYAAQFYLSTPQTQCLNAVRYVKQVDELCTKNGTPGKECLANLFLTEPIDGALRVLDLPTRSLLTSEEQCIGFTGVGEPGSQAEKLAQAVRGVTPYMPKTFKVGFLVNHTVLSDRNKFSWGAQFLQDTLATWFSGEEESALDPQEKVDIIPIWYYAGMTTSEFASDQLRSYPIDPTDDPLMTAEKPSRNPTNFAGPLWQSYAPVLPLHTQEAIARDKERTVKQNFAMMEALQGILGADRISRDQLAGLLGSDRVTGLKFTAEPFWKQTEYSLPMLCSDPEACRCYKENEEDTSCLNQTRDSVIDSFPVNFAEKIPNQDEYVEQLRDEILTRINAGIQQTETYPQEIEGQPIGPLSKRFIGMCAVDQENTKYGVQETSTGIVQDVLQPLGESDDPERSPMTDFLNQIRAKIIGGLQLGETKFQNDRTSRTYIILPDESMDIEIMQAYLAPMFLSPQMYESIMSGENEQYPFLEAWVKRMEEQGVPAGDPANDPFISAFLRANGPSRQITNEEVGYVQVERVTYRTEGDCSRATQGDLRDCKCTQEVLGRSTDEQWVPIEEFDGEDAHPRNNCVAETPLNTRPVSVGAEFPAESPDESVQTPGGLFALNEYLRRLAFTPLHMQAFESYPGLEKFYQAVAGVSGRTTTLPDTTELSEYFKTLVENISQAWQGAPRSGSCDVVYVSPSEAASLAAPVITLLNDPSFGKYVANQVGSGNEMLFQDCQGQKCFEFMTQVLTSTPVCNGQEVINPLLAFGIAWNEEPKGLPNTNDWHFGCNVTAYESYQGTTGTYLGQNCTVKTSAGHEVINPVIIAQTGANFSTAGYAACVAPTQTVTRNVAAQKQNSPMDGFACMIARMNASCSSQNDMDVLWGYGYNPAANPGVSLEKANPSVPFGRLAEFATLAERAMRDGALVRTPENTAAVAEIRSIYNTMKSRMLSANCPSDNWQKSSSHFAY